MSSLLLATLFAVWIATAAVGWRAVRRGRARSREINAQIEGIHRRLDRHEQDRDRRVRRRAEFDALLFAEREVQLALAVGELPAACSVKLLGHIQDLRAALLSPEREA